MAERGKDRRTRSGLPLFRGTPQEVAAFQLALRSFGEARDTRRGLEFQSVLPQIIGVVPPQERGFLTTFVPQRGLPRTGVMLAAGDPDFEAFLAGMPTVRHLIEKDIARMSRDLELDSIVLDRKVTEAGSLPRPVRVWHIDPDLCYLITDQQPTEFYQGPARLQQGGILLDPASIDPTVRPVAAPPFAIVRQGPLTVHRAPIFTRRAQRTFVDFLTSRR